MSVKNSKTTADYLDFDSTLNKSMRLLKNDPKNYKIAFLAIVGINFGLRISDILSLKHKDIKKDSFTLIERKTGKQRIIEVNDNVKKGYDIYRKRLGLINDDDFIFISQKGSVFSIRQVNRMLQSNYGSKKKNVSSHSLRKTFGRRVWDNDNNSERALILLSKIFNHSTTQTTRTYLGIQQEEISNVYLNL